MRIHRCLLAALLLASAPLIAQGSDQQIVNNAFPMDLIDPEFPHARGSTFVTADLKGDGDRVIIALYTDGSRSEISVLDRTGRVLAHPELPSFKGKGELELTDLDGDGIPEIIAQMYSGHQPQIPDTWGFAWRDGQLALISPTERVGELDITPLSQMAPIDLDGSGKMALLAFPGVRRDASGNPVPDGDTLLYKLVDGKFSPTATRFVFAKPFYRRTCS